MRSLTPYLDVSLIVEACCIRVDGCDKHIKDAPCCRWDGFHGILDAITLFRGQARLQRLNHCLHGPYTSLSNPFENLRLCSHRP